MRHPWSLRVIYLSWRIRYVVCAIAITALLYTYGLEPITLMIIGALATMFCYGRYNLMHDSTFRWFLAMIASTIFTIACAIQLFV